MLYGDNTPLEYIGTDDEDPCDEHMMEPDIERGILEADRFHEEVSGSFASVQAVPVDDSISGSCQLGREVIAAMQFYSSPQTSGPLHLQFWCLRSAVRWNLVTCNPFFVQMGQGELMAIQREVWLKDCYAISLAVAEASMRVSTMMQVPVSFSTAASIAQVEARLFSSKILQQGYGNENRLFFSAKANNIVEFIESKTQRDSPPVFAMTTVLSYLVCFTQCWIFHTWEHRFIPEWFTDFEKWFNAPTRRLAISDLCDTLDSVLSQDIVACAEREYFGEVCRRMMDHYNYLTSLRFVNTHAMSE